MRAIYERAFGAMAISLVVTGAVVAMNVGAAAAAQDSDQTSSAGKCHVGSLCFDNDKGRQNDAQRSSNGSEPGNDGSSSGSGSSGNGSGKTAEPGAGGSEPKDPDAPAGI
jgi:hypothetical protein